MFLKVIAVVSIFSKFSKTVGLLGVRLDLAKLRLKNHYLNPIYPGLSPFTVQDNCWSSMHFLASSATEKSAACIWALLFAIYFVRIPFVFHLTAVASSTQTVLFVVQII